MPDRSTRFRKGKSDPTDAEMAARAVLAGVANATPQSGEGETEMIRMLKSTKDSAAKARTQAINQMKALVVTAPAEQGNRRNRRGFRSPWPRLSARLVQFWLLPLQLPSSGSSVVMLSGHCDYAMACVFGYF